MHIIFQQSDERSTNQNIYKETISIFFFSCEGAIDSISTAVSDPSQMLNC